MEHKSTNKEDGRPAFTRDKDDCSCGCGANCQCHKQHRYGPVRPGEAVYGLGVIGALVYYLTTAATFWLGVLGVFKAVFWPAFIVYELLKFFHMS